MTRCLIDKLRINQTTFCLFSNLFSLPLQEHKSKIIVIPSETAKISATCLKWGQPFCSRAGSLILMVDLVEWCWHLTATVLVKKQDWTTPGDVAEPSHDHYWSSRFNQYVYNYYSPYTSMLKPD